MHRIILLALCLLPIAASAQFQEAKRYSLSDEERNQLTAGRDRLKSIVENLRSTITADSKGRDAFPDVEIMLDAVDRNLRQNLFFSKKNVEEALACVKLGEERVALLKSGQSPWTRQKGITVLGHRSKVDGSSQPFQIYVPESYDFESPKPMRVEIFLHGRAATMNEPNFIRSTGWLKSNFGREKLDCIALYPYGRSNNGWRFAGERDVFEALENLKRLCKVDEDRITIRGFSMGGHGTWHLGLQHPGDWAAMSPGAGFAETKVYQKMTEPMEEWREKLLHLYDPLDYAANAKNLPLLHYVGDADPAIKQHMLMVDALKRESAPYQEFIGEKTEHRYHPAQLQAILAELAPSKRDFFAPVHFVTYTLRFPDCRWVRIEGLEKHWARAEVNATMNADRVTVKTRNVSALKLSLNPEQTGWQVRVDDQQLSIRASGRPVALLNKAGKWVVETPKDVRKTPGLQGPIDDALFGPVVAVVGTGTPWTPSLNDWATRELGRMRESWDRFFRATLPEIKDTDAQKSPDANLYLYGDPGSNAVLSRLLPKLPLRWTQDEIVIADKTFSTKDHLPMLIFPNPERPNRYIVINSAMTFSTAHQIASNAQQRPRLPDYAVIRYDANAFTDDRTKDVALAGFFDERWRIRPSR